MTSVTKFDTFTHATHWNIQKREGDVYDFITDRTSEAAHITEGRRGWNQLTGKNADSYMEHRLWLADWAESKGLLWTPTRLTYEALHKTFHSDIAPFEVVERDGNILVTAGIEELINLLIGESAVEFDNTNAYIGVGDSSTGASIGQTDLQASSNKLRKGMNGGYPDENAPSVTFQSTFGSSEANFAWAEIGTFNASTGGVMLNRVVQSLGTKASGASWSISETITFS